MKNQRIYKASYKLTKLDTKFNLRHHAQQILSIWQGALIKTLYKNQTEINQYALQAIYAYK